MDTILLVVSVLGFFAVLAHLLLRRVCPARLPVGPARRGRLRREGRPRARRFDLRARRPASRRARTSESSTRPTTRTVSRACVPASQAEGEQRNPVIVSSAEEIAAWSSTAPTACARSRSSAAASRWSSSSQPPETGRELGAPPGRHRHPADLHAIEEVAVADPGEHERRFAEVRDGARGEAISAFARGRGCRPRCGRCGRCRRSIPRGRSCGGSTPRHPAVGEDGGRAPLPDLHPGRAGRGRPLRDGACRPASPASASRSGSSTSGTPCEKMRDGDARRPQRRAHGRSCGSAGRRTASATTTSPSSSSSKPGPGTPTASR